MLYVALLLSVFFAQVNLCIVFWGYFVSDNNYCGCYSSFIGFIPITSCCVNFHYFAECCFVSDNINKRQASCEECEEKTSISSTIEKNKQHHRTRTIVHGIALS